VVAQQQQPCVDGAGDGGCEPAGTGDQLEALGMESVDRGGRRGGSLAHQHRGRGVVRGREDRDEVAPGAVEVRFHHVEHEPPRDDGVERVAAALQHRLSG
jgi:hypothetical protein